MWSIKKNEKYDVSNVEREDQLTNSSNLNSCTAVVYHSLSVNTQNALEVIDKQYPNISLVSRHNSIAFEVKEIEKIEEAIALGYIETFKVTQNEQLPSDNSYIPKYLNYRKASICTKKGTENLKISKQQLIYEDNLNSASKKQKLDIVFDDHLIDLNEFIYRYETSLTEGLNDEQIKSRLERDGKNIMTKKKSKPLIVRYLVEVFGGYNIIMWFAAIASVICWRPLGGDNPSPYNLVLAIFLLVSILFQATFSFFQQCKSDNLMASFEKFMPSKACVLRMGKWKDVDSSELVVGDVVKLSSGEKIPADLRIFDAQQASIDKSCINGESEPVKLNPTTIDPNPYETKNIAMFGSLVMEGNAIGIVFQTGDKTIMAKIASLALNAKGEITTMQREINHFALLIGAMSLLTGLLTFFIWYFVIRVHHPQFLNVSQIISICIGIVIGFFPMGLPMAVTMTLTIIAKKMKKENVLVKKMAIIETLGSTTVIASDKTGTITMNKMTLLHLSIANFDEFDCLTNSEIISDYYKALINFASLCNKAKMDEENVFKGSATECGILKFTASTMNWVENLREQNPIINEIPFNSRNKFHLTIHKLNKNEFSPIPLSCTSLLDRSKDLLCIIKGAPEVIFDLCSSGLNRDKIESFEETKNLCYDQSIKYASNGERVLGLAFSFISYDEQLLIEENNLPKDLCFVGLVSLIDPPRPGVADAVNQCHEGSIKVMMVTGDHYLTAISIAKMVNIVSLKSKIKYFDEIDDELKKIIPEKKPPKSCFQNKFKFFEVITSKIFPKERKSIVTKYKVDGAVVISGKDFPFFNDQHWDYIFSHNEIIFARTTPQNKLLIVNELRRNGEIVTVTGDGVNDAPALKRADIGIAMGITGTEVSKEASKVIIMDDNFATIVLAISQGRLLFNNLKKVIGYLLPAGSFSEILPVLANVFLGLPMPLTVLAMLVICLLTDVFGALAMVYELPENDIMKRKPRNVSVDRLISFKGVLKIYLQIGVFESIIAFFIYYYTMSIYGIECSKLIGAFEKWDLDYMYAGVDLKRRNEALTVASTGFFASLVITQLINLCTVRTTYQSFFKQKIRPRFILFMLAEIIIVILYCYIPPFQPYFQSANLNWYHFVFPLAMGLSIFIIDEIKKLLFRKYPNSFIKHFIF